MNQVGINGQVFSVLKASEESGIPVLFVSNPGFGKTTTIEAFANIYGYEVVVLKGNSSTPEEILGYDTVDPTVIQSKKEATHLQPSWFGQVRQNTINGKKTLLFLDEITTVNEYVQAALLQVVFGRKISDDNDGKLPDDCLIVAAGNYAQNLSHTMTVLPPTMNRFCIYNLAFDPKIDGLEFLNKYSQAGLSGFDPDNIDINPTFNENLIALTKMRLCNADNKDARAKVAKMFESGIREVLVAQTSSKKSTTSSKQVTNIDLNYKNLMNYYSESTENGGELLGFVSPRTLNYLRDMAVAIYFNYGTDGMQSKILENVVRGLVGVGFTRNGDDYDTVMIYSDYVNKLREISKEADKLNNDSIKEYEKILNPILEKINSGKKTNSNGMVTYGYAITEDDAKVIRTTLRSMFNDPKVENVTSPVEASDLIDFLKSYKDYFTKKVDSKGKAAKECVDTYKSLTLEELNLLISSANDVNEVIHEVLHKIVGVAQGTSSNSVAKFKYDGNTVATLRTLCSTLNNRAKNIQSFKIMWINGAKEAKDDRVSLVLEMKNMDSNKLKAADLENL